MARIIAMTAWLCGFLSAIFKILRLSETIFEVTKKEQSSSTEESDEKLGGSHLIIHQFLCLAQ